MPVASGSSPRGRGKPRLRGSSADPRPAHPRAGGENFENGFDCARRLGSSPRGRGKPPPMSATCSLTKAHPRAGGENILRSVGGPHAQGSSPRGRGKPELTMEDATALGLIPARAGKTSVFLRWRPHHWAHPRAGGENPVTLFRLSAYSGSSPRGRGKPELLGDRTAAPGLIPARAGKTSRARVWCWGSRDHPRAGGENWAARRATCPSLGSSPRGRGKQRPSDEIGRGVGLIPARAGKT